MTSVPRWLPLAVLLFLALTTGARLIGLRRSGVDAMAVRSGDDAHAFLGRAFAGLLAATVLFCVVHAIRPDATGALGRLTWMTHDVAGWIGAGLAVAGALLAGIAQFGMGRSWRIGVREGDKSTLVNDGLYRFSRNPIYVGMLASLIGIFLIAPNAVTLTLLIASWITMSAQIRLEEDFLAGMHSDAYAAYRSQTRRWL